MCHHVHVQANLTPAEKRAARKMYGVMIPVYASIALMMLAALAATHQPQRGATMTAEAAGSPVSAGDR
jgi:hypothetical protein